MVEMIVVLAVGGILLSMAIGGFGDATSGFAVRSARQSYAALQARTRAHALERGRITRFHTDPAGDSVWIEASSGTVERVDFGESRDIDVRSGTSGVITLCMNPRGFGETSCNSFGSGSVDVSFVRGSESASVTILPLGQLEW